MKKEEFSYRVVDASKMPKGCGRKLFTGYDEAILKLKSLPAGKCIAIERNGTNRNTVWARIQKAKERLGVDIHSRMDENAVYIFKD